MKEVSPLVATILIVCLAIVFGSVFMLYSHMRENVITPPATPLSCGDAIIALEANGCYGKQLQIAIFGSRTIPSNQLFVQIKQRGSLNFQPIATEIHEKTLVTVKYDDGLGAPEVSLIPLVKFAGKVNLCTEQAVPVAMQPC